MIRTISILLENKPGALAKVIGILAARAYNVESLSVAPTEEHSVSRMTICVDIEDEMVEQLLLQLDKIVVVLEVRDLTGTPQVDREIALIKVKTKANGTSPEGIDLFRVDVVDVTPGGYTLQVTGHSEQIESLLQMLRKHGEIEVIRSGTLALSREAKAK